ncbi:MAG: hypothetical protein ACXV1K_04140 [Kineosporiaceae bacterium]
MEIDGSKADGATSSSYERAVARHLFGRRAAHHAPAHRDGHGDELGDASAGGSGDKTTIQVMLGELSPP